MTFWVPLWKYVFLAGVSSFAVLSLWVAIAGWGDIKRMFRALSSKVISREADKNRE